ncbi:MAG TPA: 4-oxalocrotonate tautomerase family protein [Megamonas hypermegale]|uniref:Tautomerase n=1 Tax=Megamonas hypermegale TaxID=158847 RepID=A0A921L7A4_9FIRM|nr:4-oxalocrotonate tautomerase DmpI [Megamonas hypermegale]MDM8143723.1 2-hydroxymuconate tautomerase family protein [Megamonas hypermegale]HJF84629.1 4-oxalocrotonate tautomerase family protein [Megamonas hypermegale]
MPFIQVETASATKEQKQALIAELTDAASRIMGIDAEAFYVLIKENSTDNWGLGGRVLTDVLKNK